MKKILVFIFTLLFTSSIYSEDYNGSVPFSVYSIDEARSIIGTMQLMNQFENGEDAPENELDRLVRYGLAVNDVSGLFIRSYLKDTKSEIIRSLVENHLNTLESEKWRDSILHRYESEVIDDSENDTIRYSFENGKEYDENISFAFLKPVPLFDQQLQVYIPDGNWNIFNFTDPESDDDKNTITLIAGGPTTACSIVFTREPYSNISETLSQLDYDLTGEKIMNYKNADGCGLSIFRSEDNLLIFSFVMFDEDNNMKYTALYNYNISIINMNYRIYEDMKKLMIYSSFLSYLPK